MERTLRRPREKAFGGSDLVKVNARVERARDFVGLELQRKK
jgi:hypothetical protein